MDAALRTYGHAIILIVVTWALQHITSLISREKLWPYTSRNSQSSTPLPTLLKALNAMMDNWRISRKLRCMVHDNSANISCMIQLVVNDGLKTHRALRDALSIARHNFRHFNHSLPTAEKFHHIQVEHLPSSLPLTEVQDVPSWRNSTFYMEEWLLHLCCALVLNVDVYRRSITIPTGNQWTLLAGHVGSSVPLQVAHPGVEFFSSIRKYDTTHCPALDQLPLEDTKQWPWYNAEGTAIIPIPQIQRHRGQPSPDGSNTSWSMVQAAFLRRCSDCNQYTKSPEWKPLLEVRCSSLGSCPACLHRGQSMGCHRYIHWEWPSIHGQEEPSCQNGSLYEGGIDWPVCGPAGMVDHQSASLLAAHVYCPALLDHPAYKDGQWKNFQCLGIWAITDTVAWWWNTWNCW